MMPRTIDDNGSHRGTPTRPRKGLISPLIGTGLKAPYWGWQLIGRMLTPGIPEYHGVVSDSLGTIVWESEWVPKELHNDLWERTRSVAVHHNLWGCNTPGCQRRHEGQENWDA